MQTAFMLKQLSIKALFVLHDPGCIITRLRQHFSILATLLLALALFLTLGSAAQAQGFPANFDISTLNGTNGVSLDTTLDDFGDVAMIGDINGDGIGDMAVARQDLGGGRIYVVFGRQAAFANPLDVTAVSGSDGFVINGVAQNDNAGISIAAAGDVNGDGVADMIIGAPFTDPGGVNAAGSAYVIFGHTGAFASPIALSALDGSDGFAMNFNVDAGQAGFSVSSAGDLNKDGFNDVIVGAPFADPASNVNAGSSFVVFGHTGAFTPAIDLSALSGADGFAINGGNGGERSGFSVGHAGDFNGDGVDDLVIGASSTGFNNGATYVVFGHTGAFSAALELPSLDGSNGMAINGAASGDFAGTSVSGAGDVNGDHISDIIIGAPQADPGSANSNAGSAYVVFGHLGAFPASMSLSALDGSNGFTLNGINPSDQAGNAVSSAGDVNRDGVDDVIIGAFRTGNDAGAAFVIYGHISAFSASMELSALDGSNGFAITGAADGSFFGRTVDGGDVNRDLGGASDIIISNDKRLSATVIYGIPETTGPTTLFSSVLPAARSGFVGGPAITVFASVINAGSKPALSCTIILGPTPVVSMNYQLTNSANVPVGAADQPFDLAVGQTASFILSFTPGTTGAINAFPGFSCPGATHDAIPGVNVVLITVDASAAADILSIGATPAGNGIITVPADSASFMTVSATNIGAGDAGGSSDAAMEVFLIARNTATGLTLPLTVQICETDALSVCTSALGSFVNSVIGSGPSFFAVFVSDQASGGIPLNPATTRIVVRFKDSSGTIRSETSAAVTVP
jgi:FG-GAP repeat